MSISNAVASFQPNEWLVRSIHSPFHFDLKKNQPKPQALEPRNHGNDISVSREKCTGLNRCLEIALAIDAKGIGSQTQGFLRIKFEFAEKYGFYIKYTPQLTNRVFYNIGHYDLIAPFVKKGENWIRDGQTWDQEKKREYRDRMRKLLADVEAVQWVARDALANHI